MPRMLANRDYFVDVTVNAFAPLSAENCEPATAQALVACSTSLRYCQNNVKSLSRSG